MSYHWLRTFADSWGLVFMGASFVAFIAWTFRRGAGAAHDRAAQSILEHSDDGNRTDG